jgi:alkanesulfonate monooxygenase SsuD/methylene tetrahydromethanopterin reductase-like flavin-dependent oxidoreductase (luciferase family)
MRSIRFGLSLPPIVSDVERLRELTLLADAAGLDLLGIQDHPYVSQFLDTMSLIAVLLAETKNIRIFPNVASLPLRSPALLAKTAASLDVLSGGRFELGIGAGASWDGIAAMGSQRRTAGEAIEALEEAIAVIRAIWSGKRGLRYNGKHYTLQGLHGGPVPPHAIGIWVGAVGERMLHLTGQLADGWAAPIVSYLPYERWGWAQEVIDNGAREAGREPSAVLRIANIVGNITNHSGSKQLHGSAPIEGTSTYWTEMLVSLALDVRFDAFVFWPQEMSREQVERFAHEIAPAVREAVEKAEA